MLTNVAGGPEATNKETGRLSKCPRPSSWTSTSATRWTSPAAWSAAMKAEEKAKTTGDDGKVETTKEVKMEHKDRNLKVTSMKHIAATCP